MSDEVLSAIHNNHIKQLTAPTTLYSFTNFMPRSSPSPDCNSRWLAMSLAALLAAQHITIPDDSPVPLGPGPADLFSIRFDEMFLPDAHGYVGGNPVDREGLKEALLGLQRRWDPEEATTIGTTVHPAHITEFHPTMAAKLEFTPLFRYPRCLETIMAEASGVERDGCERINILMLEGDETLFRPEP